MLRRSMLRLLLTPACALLLVCMPVFAQPPDPAARSIPANALLYASVDIQAIQQFFDHVKSSSLYRAFANIGPQKQDQGPNAAISQILNILNLAGAGKVDIAVADDEFQSGKSPSIVVVVPGKDREQGQVLLLMMSRAMPAIQKTNRDYNGVTITIFNSGPVKGGQTGFAVVNDCLLISAGVNTEWLQKTIDAAAGRGDALAADAGFKTMQKRIAGLGPNAAWVWLNMPRLLQRMYDITHKAGTTGASPTPNGKQVPNPPTRVLDPAALKSLNTMYESGAFRLVLSPQSAGVEGHFLVNGKTEIGKKILAQKGGPLRAAGLVSMNPILFVGRTDLDLIIDTWRALFPASGTGTSKMLDSLSDNFRKVTGLDLENDIVANLGSEVALALNDPPADLKSVPLLIYVETKNEEAMRRTMQKLGDAIGKAINMQMVQKELPQGQIYQFNLKGAALPVTPGWTFADNFLVISTTPDALETALRLAAGQSDSSLAASPAYQQVATETGGRVTSVFLLNAQKLEALVDRIPAQQHTAGTGQPGSVGRTQNPDMEKMKGALRALRGLSAISTVDGDAVIMKMTLSFDLTR